MNVDGRSERIEADVLELVHGEVLTPIGRDVEYGW